MSISSTPLGIACAINMAFVNCAATFDGFVQVVEAGGGPLSALFLRGIVPWVTEVYPVGQAHSEVGIKMARMRHPDAILRPLCRPEDVLHSLQTVDSLSEAAAKALADLNELLGTVVVHGGGLPFPLPGPGFEWSEESDTVSAITPFRCTVAACHVGIEGTPHLSLIAATRFGTVLVRCQGA